MGKKDGINSGMNCAGENMKYTIDELDKKEEC